MARISVSEYCKAHRVTRGDGAHLRRAIEEHWDDEAQLVLDFSGVRIASVSFFDESLGFLAKRHPLEQLTKRVRVENIDQGDRALLNRIVIAREKEREALASESRGSSKTRAR